MSYFTEKREFERIKVNTAITLSFGNPTLEMAGLCCDLSESGMAIEVSRIISIGTQCNVIIHDGHDNKSKFQAVIEIKRVHDIGQNRFRLGALIINKF